MSCRWSWLLLFLCSIVLAIVVAFAFSEDISTELHISDLIKNGVYTDGLLVQELKESQGATYFKGEYEVMGFKYDFILSDKENKLKLHDTVSIIYNRQIPSEYIIESYYNSKGLPYVSVSVICILFLIFLGLWALYDFIKIGYLEDNGKRVLCEPIKYKWKWWVGPASAIVKCKVPGDDFQIYKGTCYLNFEDKMKMNSLKYIPVYISQNRKSFYYVHCIEVERMIKHGKYNGYTIEELKKPMQ